MQERIRRDATDPDVVRTTAGLAAYLRELVLTARRPIKDCTRYESRVWLAELPEGVERPSATADGVLLTLDHIARIASPALPEVLKEWVDHDASLDAARPDPPLAEEGPSEVWGTDENGIPALAGWDPADWRGRALTDRLARRNTTLWEHLAATVEQAYAAAEAAVARQARQQVQIPDVSLAELPAAIRTVGKLWAHLRAGNRLRRRLQSKEQRAAAWLLDACTVDGQPLETADDLRAVAERLRAEKAVAEAAREWAQVGVFDDQGVLAVRLAAWLTGPPTCSTLRPSERPGTPWTRSSCNRMPASSSPPRRHGTPCAGRS